MSLYTRRIIFILLISSLVSVAQDQSAEQVLKNVREKYASMNDASASFVQKTMLRFGKREQVQSGAISMKKGNKYRLETAGEQFISDGETVWIVSTSNNQVLVDAFKQNNRIFSPDKFLLGLPDDFTARDLVKAGKLLKMTLVPKKANAQTRQVRSLSAWVEPASWVVKKIEYTDRNMNKIEITISNVRFNITLPDSVFQFDPPDGMKVVDLRTLK